jgi:hypothetical protein
LILNENHLHRVLQEYGEYYNHARPHQGLNQHFPIFWPESNNGGLIRRRDILGGVIYDDYMKIGYDEDRKQIVFLGKSEVGSIESWIWDGDSWALAATG